MAIQKDEKHRVEYGDFDIQLHQRGQAVDGFSEIDRFGVEIHFFNFGVGTHHDGAGSRKRSGAQRQALVGGLDVGFMARLRFTNPDYPGCRARPDVHSMGGGIPMPWPTPALRRRLRNGSQHAGGIPCADPATLRHHRRETTGRRKSWTRPPFSCNAFDGTQSLFLDGDHISGHGNDVLLLSFSQFMTPRLGRYTASLEDGFTATPARRASYGTSRASPRPSRGAAGPGQSQHHLRRATAQGLRPGLEASAYGTYIGKPVKLVIGGVEREVVLNRELFTVQVCFEGVEGAITLDIVPPSPISRAVFDGNRDTRELGVGLAAVCGCLGWVTRRRVRWCSGCPGLKSSRARRL